MDNLKPHKLALLFPEVLGEEFDQLVSDIKRGGLLEPIWLYEGKVLDGWHRYRASKKAGVEPKTRTWRGDDPMAFVVSMNIMRRHLNESQRVMLRVRAAKISGELKAHGGKQVPADGTRSRKELAADVGVGTSLVDYARRVEREKPELGDKIIAGDLSLSEAQKRMPKARPVARPAQDADWKNAPSVRSTLKFITAQEQSMSQIADAVRAGKLSPEAKRFLAVRVRSIARAWDKFATWLEG